MFRWICLSSGLLVCASSIASQLMGISNKLNDYELATSWGGNTYNGVDTLRCDSAQGGSSYLGCTEPGGPCFQCVTGQINGSYPPAMSRQLVSLQQAVSPGWKVDFQGQPQQNCGGLFRGICVEDRSSPTQYTCSGGVVGGCTAQDPIIKQPPKPTNPGDPG